MHKVMTYEQLQDFVLLLVDARLQRKVSERVHFERGAVALEQSANHLLVSSESDILCEYYKCL